MTFLRAASMFACICVLCGTVRAETNDARLQGGAYQVKVRLEIPNVWNWSAAKTDTICVPNAPVAGEAPLPVLSGNNPLAKCPAANIEQNGASLTFDIACEGRDAARARAVYKLGPGAFEGRIAMVMGAKNMTMTEVQIGRRIGSCDLAAAPAN